MEVGQDHTLNGKLPKLSCDKPGTGGAAGAEIKFQERGFTIQSASTSSRAESFRCQDLRNTTLPLAIDKVNIQRFNRFNSGITLPLIDG